MKKVIAVIGITTLFVSSSFCQVHIKEQLTIQAGQSKKTEDVGTNNHVLSFTLSLQYTGDSAIIVVSGPNNYYKVFSGLGSDSGVIQSPAAGAYYFIPCINNLYHSFDQGNCFTVYLDGARVPWAGPQCGSGQSGTYGGWIVMDDFVGSFQTPYFSKFNLLLTGINPGNQPDYLGHGEEGSIAVQGYNDNTTTAWSSHTDPLTVTIVSGSQYASFHRLNYKTGNDQNLGSTINIVGDSIYNNTFDPNGGYYIEADGIQPDSNAAWIVVEAESGGLISTDTLEMMPPPVVTVTPNELQPLNNAAISVKHRDFDGKLIDYPANQLFSVGILDGERYGSIISPNGLAKEDISGVQPPFTFWAFEIDSDSVSVVVIVGTDYSGPAIIDAMTPAGKDGAQKDSTDENVKTITNAKATAGKSVASGVGVTGSRKILSSVDLPWPDSGVNTVIIKNQNDTITIDIPAPKQTWPTLPTSSGGNPNERNVQYFTVTAMNGNNPLPNYGVTLTASMILPSGGHNHTNQPNTEDMGELEDYVNHIDGNGTITTTTDENGEINLAFTAPEFSGIVLITATSTTENVKSNDSIFVKVPDLIQMGGGANLITYTSTPNLHKLEDSDYGTPTVNAAIIDAVKSYADYYGTDSDIFLAAIDMSLPWGGLFDINGDWNTPHSLHRVGKSVDFSKWYRDASGNVISVDIYVDGKLWRTTNMVNQKILDSYFAEESFDRKERNIGKIHYEYNK